MKLKALAACAVLALGAGSAAAQSFATEAMSPGTTPGTWSFSGNADKSFSVLLAPGLYSAASFTFGVPFNLGFSIDSVTLSSSGGGPAQAFSEVTPYTYIFNGSLTGGATYYVNVDVSGTGVYGGAFSVTAVPEPQTYAMLLAGLGAIGFMVRRRNG